MHYLSRDDFNAVVDQARSSIREAIWDALVGDPRRIANWHAASDELGYRCISYEAPPDDCDGHPRAWQGDVVEDSDGIVTVRYLATGTRQQQVERIAHELAEELLYERAPKLFMWVGAYNLLAFGVYTPEDALDKLAGQIARELVVRAFPIRVSPADHWAALRATATGWHLEWRRTQWVPEPVGVNLEEEGWCLG